MAHFHVSVCLLGPPGTSWLAFGKLWEPFFDTWGLFWSLESVLGEFLGFLGAPGTFPGTLGRVLPGLGALGRSNYVFGELMVGFESMGIC